jgi:hypothetical protein
MTSKDCEDQLVSATQRHITKLERELVTAPPECIAGIVADLEASRSLLALFEENFAKSYESARATLH